MVEEIQKDFTMTNDVLGFWDGMVASAHSELPPYWSKNRDLFLRNSVFANSFLTSVVATIQQLLFGIEFAVAPRDANIEIQTKLASVYNTMLRTAIDSDDYEKFIFDLLCADNGGFLFITGNEPSHLPLTDIPYGVKHLESLKCQRTGDEQYPVLYEGNGQISRIHWSRVIAITQLPSPVTAMNGVGLSFVSRVFVLCSHMLDVSLTESESIGSLNPNELIVVSGAQSSDVEDAFNKAKIESINEGRKRISKRVLIGLRDPNSKLARVMMRNFPEGFDKRDDTEITLTLIALAAGVSPLYLFDSVKSGSTKASASTSVSTNSHKLLNWYIQKIKSEFENKLISPLLQIDLPEKESDTDGVKARIKLNLANADKIRLEANIINIRTAREKAVGRGELTQAQFMELELQDGRLPSGLPIHALFFSDKAKIVQLLKLSFDPLKPIDDVDSAIEEIELKVQEALRQAMNGRSVEVQSNARLCYYALLWLKEKYEEVTVVSKPAISTEEMNKLDEQILPVEEDEDTQLQEFDENNYEQLE